MPEENFKNYNDCAPVTTNLTVNLDETLKLPKPGVAVISLSVAYGTQTIEAEFQIKDYDGRVPGPQKNAKALLYAIVAILKKEWP